MSTSQKLTNLNTFIKCLHHKYKIKPRAYKNERYIEASPLKIKP